MHRSRAFGLRAYYALYLGLLAIAVAASGLLFAVISRGRTYADTIDSIERSGRIVLNLIPSDIVADPSAASRFCLRVAAETDVRVTLIRRDGTVLGDSHADARAMDNHADRPEVRTALTGTIGEAVRYSATLGKEMIYVALPVRPEDQTTAVLRVAAPVVDVERYLAGLYVSIVLLGALVVIVALLAAVFLSRSVRLPLRDLQESARAFAEGNLRFPVTIGGPFEIRRVAETAKTMALELERRIAEANERQAEIETIVNTMQDSVVVVDERLEVKWLNAPATALIDSTSSGIPEGVRLLQLFRCSALQKLLEGVLADGQPVREVISCYREREYELEVFSTPLPRAHPDRPSQILIVMRDLDRLRKVERVRRDFVANVSHELKTPLTLIKGAAETLSDLVSSSDSRAAQFATMIERHANRIGDVLDDLLRLSRIEANERLEIERASIAVRGIVADAVETVSPDAEERNMRISVDCPEDLRFPVHESMLLQALVNLLQNAIRYSDPDRSVEVSVAVESEVLRIAVSDEGWGIPYAEQDRVFERFYRVDKGRSRATGGTGLGLSIVRHVALAHRGRVQLESSPGEGSRFTMHIPPPAETEVSAS